MVREVISSRLATYVKPLMMLYSCLITPPFSLATALALEDIYVSTKVVAPSAVRRLTYPTPRQERQPLK